MYDSCTFVSSISFFFVSGVEFPHAISSTTFCMTSSTSSTSSPSPTTDLHLDAVWALATKRDPAMQLDLCEQRSKTTLEGTVAQRRFPTVATKYLARPLSRRRIQTVKPPYEKVQVPSRIFPVDTGSARGILPVGITAIRSEGAEGAGALGHTSGCHRGSSDSPVLLIREGS